jgi:hypothetical protein
LSPPKSANNLCRLRPIFYFRTGRQGVFDGVSRASNFKEIGMPNIIKCGTFALGEPTVKRLGYGAMQLTGPGVFGPPKDPGAARAMLREAVASGVNHIDTSDFYGPHVTNQLIREALHPYPDDLAIVTKVGARRGADASWLPRLLASRVDAGGARQPA